MEKHGLYKSRTYRKWADMKSRCSNSNNPKNKKNYINKNIKVDPSWDNFETFYSDMGHCPQGMELDRIDGSKGYFKNNCRWATRDHNQSNRILKKGKYPRGIYPIKNKFHAKIRIANIQIYLGNKKSIEEAQKLYDDTYKEWYGEFPPEYRI